jgi:[acyl-carrier-protein] S-malonyltransferase
MSLDFIGLEVENEKRLSQFHDLSSLNRKMGNIFGMVKRFFVNKNSVSILHSNAFALIFPGQASQFIGMSKQLIASSCLARQLFEEASEIVGFSLGKIASESGMHHWQNKPEVVQPLILTHSVAAFKVNFPSLPKDSVMIGHSLGQYSALCAAKSISFAQAIQLVVMMRNLCVFYFVILQHYRGLLMGKLVEKEEKEFSLVALLGQKAFENLEFLKKIPFFCQLSSINSAKQIVVAIEGKNFEKLKSFAKNFHCIKLNTQIPFHTSLMLDIVPEFESELHSVTFKEPKFTVLSNVSTLPIVAVNVIQDLLAHLHQPVRFHESIQRVREMGIVKFCDIGPSEIFFRLLQREYPHSFAAMTD